MEPCLTEQIIEQSPCCQFVIDDQDVRTIVPPYGEKAQSRKKFRCTSLEGFLVCLESVLTLAARPNLRAYTYPRSPEIPITEC